MNISEANAKAHAYCENHRKIVTLMPIIRKVIERFDGKVYNKRLDTAIEKAIADQFGTDKPEYFITTGKSINQMHVFIYGHIRMNYQDSPILCEIILTEDKRIDAKQALDSCNEREDGILKKCERIEQQLGDMPEIISQIDELVRKRDEVTSKIDSNLYYWFDIESVKKYGSRW